MIEDELPEPLQQGLQRFEDALARGDFEAAQRALDAAAAGPLADHTELLYARACLFAERDGLQAAVPLLQRVVIQHERHADAHYALAQAAQERGDEQLMIEHHLRVRVLDARADRDGGVGSPDEVDYLEQVARELLAELPEPFQSRLAHVPVVLERRPTRALVAEGFDPRALGLFEGAPDGTPDSMSPSRIVLFTCNLLAEFPDEPELSEQIEITLLHEIGHYFGLDEDDMVRLGLE